RFIAYASRVGAAPNSADARTDTTLTWASARRSTALRPLARRVPPKQGGCGIASTVARLLPFPLRAMLGLALWEAPAAALRALCLNVRLWGEAATVHPLFRGESLIRGNRRTDDGEHGGPLRGSPVRLGQGGAAAAAGGGRPQGLPGHA